jgi:Protein of unknown function (DUF3040)
MALTDREQQTLDEIARRLRVEDPAFARRLRRFAEPNAAVSSRRRLMPIALVVVITVVGLLLLPQGTAHGGSSGRGTDVTREAGIP